MVRKKDNTKPRRRARRREDRRLGLPRRSERGPRTNSLSTRSPYGTPLGGRLRHVECVKYLASQNLDLAEANDERLHSPALCCKERANSSLPLVNRGLAGVEADALADADVTPFQLACWQVREEVMRYLASRNDADRAENDFG